MSKPLLRKTLRDSLRLISQADLKSQSQNILTVLASLNLNNVTKIALYLNFDHSEVKTDSIIQKMFELNKRVFLPKVVPILPEEKRHDNHKFKLEFLELEAYKNVKELQPQGKFKIREPQSGFNIMDDDDDTGFDMIVLPGLAFTKDCYRMGHGAGLYDDFIHRHNTRFKTKPYLLGIGLQEQLVDELPLEDHDEKLDALIINKDFYGTPI